MNKFVLVPSKLPGYLGWGGGMERQTVIYFHIHNALHNGWLVMESLNALTERICNSGDTYIAEESMLLLPGWKKKVMLEG